MTEAEWLVCNDPGPMLRHLPRRTARKFRLFAVACCRRIWSFFKDEMGRSAVEVAERMIDGAEIEAAWLADMREGLFNRGISYIDGFKREREVNMASNAAYAAYHALQDEGQFLLGAPQTGSCECDLFQSPVQACWAVAHWHRRGDEDEMPWKEAESEEREQVALLRDIFGNPFRPTTCDPSGLPPSVTRIAREAYQEPWFPSGALDREQLSILGDALEDAGCADADLLGHLRGPGPHVRGCWALDLVLGRT